MQFHRPAPWSHSLFENAMTEVHFRQVTAKRGNSFDLTDRIERSGLDTNEARALVKDTSHG
jgi:hypothetical protein